MYPCVRLTIVFTLHRETYICVQGWYVAYNGVDIACMPFHPREAHPHGQLAVDALSVQQVVLHV